MCNYYFIFSKVVLDISIVEYFIRENAGIEFLFVIF